MWIIAADRRSLPIPAVAKMVVDEQGAITVVIGGVEPEIAFHQPLRFCCLSKHLLTERDLMRQQPQRRPVLRDNPGQCFCGGQSGIVDDKPGPLQGGITIMYRSVGCLAQRTGRNQGEDIVQHFEAVDRLRVALQEI